MQARPSEAPLARPIVRAAIAAVLLAAMGGAYLLFGRATSDDGESTAVAAYGSPVYRLCDASDATSASTPLPALPGGPPVLGQPAPGMLLCRDGQPPMALSDLRGKVVWLNFWATWCVPCRRELPGIQRLYDERRSDGLEVLLVNVEESPEDATAFLRDLGIDMPVVLDRQAELYEDYALRGLPDSFFIDRDGNVAALQYGFLNERLARERLADAGLP